MPLQLEPWLEALLAPLIAALALPRYSLAAVFIVALLSGTLLPLGSEPLVYGVVLLNPSDFWPVMLAATAGGTAGGAISWLMGAGAKRAVERVAGARPVEQRALQWLQRFGPKACVLAWLPVIGDPLCAVAGWLRLPLGPCLAWMAAGKLARYVVFTALLVRVWPPAT